MEGNIYVLRDRAAAFLVMVEVQDQKVIDNFITHLPFMGLDIRAQELLINLITELRREDRS